jgi:hypothetical protein
MQLTVTEQAIIDLQKQKEAFTARSRNFDPSAIRGADTLLTVDYVDALTRPVRLEISFDDPIRTRQQIEALQVALVEALVVTQDHGRGINRQRMDLRNIIEQAAKVLVLMHGRRPDRRDRRRNRTT